MKKLISILVLLSASSILHAADTSSGQKAEFTFGFEMNYIAAFHCGIHHNFFSEIGYRVDFKDNRFKYISNNDFYLHCGYNLARKWNMSLYLGLSGIYDVNTMLPLSLRATHYFREDERGDRCFAFIDLGTGLSLTRHPQATANGKIGCGYRISLSKVSNLDFLLAYRMVLARPEIDFDGYEVPVGRINRNNAYVSALSIGMALTF